MRRRQLFQFLSLSAVLHLSGCLPATWTVVPEVKGRVVTATGEPAAGAKIRIVPADDSSEGRSVEVTADGRGQFRRAEETQWTMVLLLPLDAIAPEFVATASHAGRQSAPEKFGGGVMNPHHFGLTNKSESFDLGDLVVYEQTGDR
jgi:hypothetical protein